MAILNSDLKDSKHSAYGLWSRYLSGHWVHLLKAVWPGGWNRHVGGMGMLVEQASCLFHFPAGFPNPGYEAENDGKPP
ncbi:MAG: hypothetical protein F6K26_36330 [Moorea sp. SIO2I5]|nr:hypothetical protein [Moorena sp. SIO2I5]